MKFRYSRDGEKETTGFSLQLFRDINMRFLQGQIVGRSRQRMKIYSVEACSLNILGNNQIHNHEFISRYKTTGYILKNGSIEPRFS